jgi:hypothetical protein
MDGRRTVFGQGPLLNMEWSVRGALDTTFRSVCWGDGVEEDERSEGWNSDDG